MQTIHDSIKKMVIFPIDTYVRLNKRWMPGGLYRIATTALLSPRNILKNKKEVSDMTMDKLNLANELVFKIKELNDFLREAKKAEVIYLSSNVINEHGKFVRKQYLELKKDMRDSLIEYFGNEVLRFEKQLEEL